MTGDLLPRGEGRVRPDRALDPALDPAGPDLVEEVRERLARFVDRRNDELLGVHPQLGDVADVLRQSVAGGKAVRARFCFWGWHGVAGGHGAPHHTAIGAGAALELFHLACLVHDDVMDRSDTRRGRPAVHRLFADRRSGGRGHDTRDHDARSEQYGEAVAVLVGDLCLTWSDQLLDEVLADVPSPAAARRVYDQMRTQVMAGQFLDLHAQDQPEGDVETARTVLRYKSAKYTAEHPMLLGGAIAGAPADLLEHYSAFALAAGEAFQLRDDLLGVFGDPSRSGKPSGDDVREGKRTVLVQLAEERARPRQRDLLRRHLGHRDLDEAALAQVRAVLVDTGAAAAVEREIVRLHDAAQSRLDRLPVPDPTRAALRDLVRACAFRTA